MLLPSKPISPVGTKSPTWSWEPSGMYVFTRMSHISPSDSYDTPSCGKKLSASVRVPSAQMLTPCIRPGAAGIRLKIHPAVADAHVEADALHVVERYLAVEEYDRILVRNHLHRADVDIAVAVAMLAVAFGVVAHAERRAEILRKEVAAAEIGYRRCARIDDRFHAGHHFLRARNADDHQTSAT